MNEQLAALIALASAKKMRDAGIEPPVYVRQVRSERDNTKPPNLHVIAPGEVSELEALVTPGREKFYTGLDKLVEATKNNGALLATKADHKVADGQAKAMQSWDKMGIYSDPRLALTPDDVSKLSDVLQVLGGDVADFAKQGLGSKSADQLLRESGEHALVPGEGGALDMGAIGKLANLKLPKELPVDRTSDVYYDPGTRGAGFKMPDVAGDFKAYVQERAKDPNAEQWVKDAAEELGKPRSTMLEHMRKALVPVRDMLEVHPNSLAVQAVVNSAGLNKDSAEEDNTSEQTEKQVVTRTTRTSGGPRVVREVVDVPVPTTPSQAEESSVLTTLAGEPSVTADVASTARANTATDSKPDKPQSKPNTSVSAKDTKASPAKVRTVPAGQTTANTNQKFISDGDVQSDNVHIDGIDFYGDNGGLQHSAMNALYRPSNAPLTLGQQIALGSILNGKKDFGGVADITESMKKSDQMHAYGALGKVGSEVLNLFANGRSADEAKAEAVSKYLLEQGDARAALGAALSEYAKAADTRAGRDLETAMLTGTPYTASGSLGYTPNGISYLTPQENGTYSIGTSSGDGAYNVTPEMASLVVRALTGDKGASHYTDVQTKALKNELEATLASLGIYGRGGNKITPEEARLRKYYEELGRAQGKAAAQGGSGNTTGFITKG